MTSISSQTQIPTQSSSSNTASQSTQSPTSPAPTATTSSLAAGSTPSTARSYASATATKTQVSPPIVSSSSASTSSGAVGGTTSPAQHGKSSSISPVNGKNSIPPAVPNMPVGPTIVNSSNAVNGDRVRKQSTNAGGPVNPIPNGGPPAQPSNNRNSIIQFGSMGGSPAADYSVPRDSSATNAPSSIPNNPRVNSPQNSPSPIPLPTASGGRPPSALQGQANNMSFGSTGGEPVDGSRQSRPQSMSQQAMPPGGPQPIHLRRESSQSAHSDMNMSGPGMGPGGPGRGGYSQTGRGRGYSPYPQHQQLPYQQSPGYRGPPSQGRGAPQFQGQGSPMPTFANPQHRSGRSPHLQHSVPGPPQMGQSPMANQAPMQPNQFGGFPPQMGPAQAQYGMQYGVQPDPHYPQYQHTAYQMYPSMQYIAPGQAPGSPRSPYPQQNAAQPQYYGQQPAQSMSRTPSGVSDPRPPSALGHSHTPSSTPGPNHSQRPSQTSNSPAPSSSQFKIPQKRGPGIIIKDPNSGAVKTFEKAPASPAPSSKSPAVASTPTPPPKSDDGLHSRTESKSHKSTEEVQNSLKEQIAKKIEAEKLESQRLKDEAEEKENREREAAERAKKEAEEAEAREKEAAAERAAQEAKEKAQKEEQERIEKEQAERAEKEAKAKAAAEAEAEAEAQRKAKDEAEAEAAASEKKHDREEVVAKDKAFTEKDNTPSTPSGLAAGVAKMSLESGTSTPASDDSMGPPSKAASANKREKPVPLDLQINTKSVEPAQPTPAMISLGSARFIDRIRDITYPPAIASPNPSLNVTNTKGKFKYDKEFLLQFQRVFKEKPVVEWDSRLKDTVGDPDAARTPSARTPQTSTRGSSGRGINVMSAFPMGTIGPPMSGRTLPPGTTSEQRASLAGVNGMASGRSAMNTPLTNFSRPPGQFPVGGPSPLSRNGSTTNLGPQANQGSASRSNNRSQRGQNSKRGMDKSNSKAEEQAAKSMPLTAHLDITPLKPSSGGWKPRSLAAASSATGMAGPAPGATGSSTHMAPDMVQRKVKANLNKMTPEKFEKIADQILEIAAQSKDETDGRTLRQVIQLTFEKATDEAHWASMYAKFCKRMLESMNPDIKDEGILDKNGNIVTGGNLFRKYLLNRCQEEFERGWKMNLPEKPEGESEEAVMLSDEYYIMAAAKRRGLGLVKFIGELYKLNMLTERIMHMCLKKLVDYEGVPDEAEVESLSSLLKTIGRNLDDTEKGKQMMDVYFSRINQMRETPALPSRLSFMLLDIMDLRRKGWDSKEDDKGPKTIQEIREEAHQAQLDKDAEKARQDSQRRGGGRMPMGRGDARQFSGGGGGHQYGMQPPPDFHKNTVSTDDLRKLGSKSGSRAVNAAQPSFGPSSMFGSRTSSGRKPLNLTKGEESGASSRTGTPPAQKDKESSSANAFSALAGLEEPENLTSPPSAPSSPPSVKSRPPQERAKSPAKGGDEEKSAP